MATFKDTLRQWFKASGDNTQGAGLVPHVIVDSLAGEVNIDVNTSAANTARTATTQVLPVQVVDAGGNVLPASPVLGAGSALIGKVGIDQTTPGTTNKVSIGTDGTVAIGTALPAGTALIGKVGIDQVTANANEVVVKSITAGENHVGQVGGHTFLVKVEKTRPADTTAYIAFDTIAESDSAGTVWTFAIGRVNSGTGTILRARVATDNAANVARLQLDLYKVAVTAINDNAEGTRLYANEANFLGSITFPALAKPTTNSTLADASAEVSIPFACVSGTQNVIGILRTLDAFTPVSGAKYSVALGGIQD